MEQVFGCRDDVIAGAGAGVLVLARNAVNFGTAHGNFEWIGGMSTVTLNSYF